MGNDVCSRIVVREIARENKIVNDELVNANLFEEF